jgi:hypothetical protein
MVFTVSLSPLAALLITGAPVVTTGADVVVDTRGANVTGANVTGAKVTGAKVTGAKVTDDEVTGAKVTGAIVTGAQLSGEAAGDEFGDGSVVEALSALASKAFKRPTGGDDEGPTVVDDDDSFFPDFLPFLLPEGDAIGEASGAPRSRVILPFTPFLDFKVITL